MQKQLTVEFDAIIPDKGVQTINARFSPALFPKGSIETPWEPNESALYGLNEAREHQGIGGRVYSLLSYDTETRLSTSMLHVATTYDQKVHDVWYTTHSGIVVPKTGLEALKTIRELENRLVHSSDEPYLQIVQAKDLISKAEYFNRIHSQQE